MSERLTTEPAAPEESFFVGGREILDDHGDTHLVGQMYAQLHTQWPH